MTSGELTSRELISGASELTSGLAELTSGVPELTSGPSVLIPPTPGKSRAKGATEPFLGAASSVDASGSDETS